MSCCGHLKPYRSLGTWAVREGFKDIFQSCEFLGCEASCRIQGDGRSRPPRKKGVSGLGLRVLGFRVSGLGFRVRFGM